MRIALALLMGICLLCGCTATPPGPSAGWIRRNGGASEGADLIRARWIAQRFCGCVDRPFQIHLLVNAEPTALAWPSGDVFLTTGLIQLLNDNEVAAVIGHELGHLILDGQTRVSLTGGHEHGEAEALADDQGIRILQASGTPTGSLKEALHKVLSYHELRGRSARQLAARIARLP